MKKKSSIKVPRLRFIDENTVAQHSMLAFAYIENVSVLRTFRFANRSEEVVP